MATGSYKSILPAVIERIEAGATEAFIATATEAARRIIDRTPVKTGRAKANWHLLVNNAEPPTSDATDPSGSTTKSRATGDARALKLGDAAVIANGLEYVAGLENGNSKQAPAGFVGITRGEVAGIFEEEMRAALR